MTQRIACSNGCDHDCDLIISNDSAALSNVLAEGWIVVLWDTAGLDEPSDHDRHKLVFCDPGCLFEHWLARMLSDPHWVGQIPAMTDRAAIESLVMEAARG